MARYIDAEQFRGKHVVAEIDGKLNSVIPYADIVYAPTADVVPKSEGKWTCGGAFDYCTNCHRGVVQPHIKCQPQYKFCPYCGAEMSLDENHFLQGKTLKGCIFVTIEREAAMEIFEEIYEDCFDQFGYIDYNALAELKKKYTEGGE